MGISKHLKNPSLRRRKDEITPNEVTELSLQVWLNLPSKIRRDPSLVSFQMEHERLHGNVESNLICLSLLNTFVSQGMSLLKKILTKLRSTTTMKINQNT